MINYQQGTDGTRRVYSFKVLHQYRALHLQRARELRGLADAGIGRLEREYKGLAALFNVEISCFERKLYENLSHEPNKAMNLNSYIGLMEKSFRERRDGARNFLEETTGADATLGIPAADYVITLDADSMLLPDYALRLIIEYRSGRPRLESPELPRTPGLQRDPPGFRFFADPAQALGQRRADHTPEAAALSRAAGR